MILKALHISNFKAFAIAQRVPLRPITLIYGANSAGKSSILHALALTHHAIETGDLDTQRTRIGGEIIDLGGFRQYVHRRDREKQVELRFELDPKQLSGRVAELLRSAEDIVVELVIGEGITREQQDLSGDQVREIVLEDSCRVERFAVEVDGVSLLSMSARAGGVLRLDRLEHGHPVFRELFRGILMLATTTEDVDEEDFVVLGDVLDSLVPGITARIRGLFPRIEEEFEASENKVRRLGCLHVGEPWAAPGGSLSRGADLRAEGVAGACRGTWFGNRRRDTSTPLSRSAAILPAASPDIYSAPRPQLVRWWRLRMGRGSQAWRSSAARECVAWRCQSLADQLRACGA